MTLLSSPRPLAPAVDAEVRRFAENGYLVLPGFLPRGLVARLRPEIDRWVDGGLRSRSIASCVNPDRYGVPPVLELDLPAHGELVAHPPLLDLLHRLMAGPFAHYHLHGDRQAPEPGRPWHHDRSRTGHGLIHVRHHLDGLDPDSAGLALLPGSHRRISAGSDLRHRGTEVRPGEVLLADLPPGSTVVLDARLCPVRPRRARAGGRGGPRYTVDASYCRAGVRWPPVKPYWRHQLRRGRELGLDRGQWPELFSEAHFREYERAA